MTDQSNWWESDPVVDAPPQGQGGDWWAADPVVGQPAQQAAQAAPEQPGILARIGDMFTGNLRATAETRALPEWTGMPELNQLSMAGLRTGLGTVIASPEEAVQVIQANFPGTQVRQDTKGNYILRSSVDGQEYAIPPGFSVGDIPRALAGVAAFTPAGRATTAGGAALAGAGTQAAIEASQAATGGRFDTGETAVAGALGAAGPLLTRAAQGVRSFFGGKKPPVAGGAIGEAAQAAPENAAASAAPEPQPAQAQQMAPEAAPQAQAATAPSATPGATTPQSATEAAAQGITAEEIGTLAQKAARSGPGSTVAQAKLIETARVNPEARAAAERLGFDLPFDVFADNPQVASLVGLTRSQVGSDAEAAWVKTVRDATARADDVVQKFDTTFIEGRPAPGAVSQRILDNLGATQAGLKAEADKLYQAVDAAMPKDSPVSMNATASLLSKVADEVGVDGFTAQEKRLMAAATDPKATYGRLLREKNLVGQALAGKASPYESLDQAILKRLYGALAQDQLDNVTAVAGEGMRSQLRAANQLVAMRKGLEKRIVGAFGKEIDGSVANLMRNAISSASKGDAAAFNKLLKAVPEELRKETVATALASVTSSGRAAADGAFGFAEFAKIYSGLRANPPVYKAIVDFLGPNSDQVLRDLYAVSKRITEARGRVLTTGKANQGMLNALRAERLVTKVMRSSMAQRAVTAAASVAGPVGGAVAPDIVNFMSRAQADPIQAAGKLFASEQFQRLATELATKAEPSEAAVKATANSPAFMRFAAKIGLKDAAARKAWIISAMQAQQNMEGQE